MKLRALEHKDAPLMLEWMHDADAVEHLHANFSTKTEADCAAFIQNSRDAKTDLHLAVADDDDAYMGTVSLKHIDRETGDAEFAIAVRRCAMGKGYAKFAMEQIIQLGQREMGLKTIFWCVSPRNLRAVRFYDKGGWQRVDPLEVNALRYYAPEQTGEYIWYCSQG